ncbi:MAG: OB-fold nucleic acid binding domain-containing protein, partial [Acidimicrobiia bacterium]
MVDPGSAEPSEEVSGSDGDAGDTSLDAAEEARDQRRQRLAKLDALRAEGIDPYPVRFDTSDTAGGLRREFATLEAGSNTDHRVRIAGRVLLLRRQGKLSFATLADRDGSIQLFVSQKAIGEADHDAFDRLDRGDWVGIEGTVMTTRRGELSVNVERFTLLAKAV